MNTVFGIVILNYFSYEDTINAVKDFLSLDDIEKHRIYIVDNGSANNSVEILEDVFKQIDNVYILPITKNVGFAKGNNIGIQRALADGCTTIICSNNDIRTLNINNIFSVLEALYMKDKGIVVIGPRIITSTGKYQNPHKINPFTQTEKFKMRLVYGTAFGYVLFWIKNYWFTKLFGFFNRKIDSHSSSSQEISSSFVYALHGSFLVFTPMFFKYFNGFDEHTFLYYEELILAERVFQKKLKMYYCSELSILHTEDAGTDAMVKKFNISKIRFVLKHNYASARYFVRNVLS